MCSDSRHRLSAQKISDLMIINLNYDAVESYKSKYGLTKSYGGQLLRLVTSTFLFGWMLMRSLPSMMSLEFLLMTRWSRITTR